MNANEKNANEREAMFTQAFNPNLFISPNWTYSVIELREFHDNLFEFQDKPAIQAVYNLVTKLWAYECDIESPSCSNQESFSKLLNSMKQEIEKAKKDLANLEDIHNSLAPFVESAIAYCLESIKTCVEKKLNREQNNPSIKVMQEAWNKTAGELNIGQQNKLSNRLNNK